MGSRCSLAEECPDVMLAASCCVFCSWGYWLVLAGLMVGGGVRSIFN